VGDEHHRQTIRQLAQRILHALLGLAVQRARRLVQEQDPGPPDECASEGDALPLPARERDPTIAECRLVATGQPVTGLP
jgi:hypothetical protein